MQMSELSLELKVSALEARVRGFRTQDRHEFFVKCALLEALAATMEGNYGIGAVLVKENRVIVRGHNRVFCPHFNSGHHAEMDVMNLHEQRMVGGGPRVNGCTLYTTLEPCPMCYGRLLTAGIKTVYYAAVDEPAGMITFLQNLKVQTRWLWSELARVDNRVFAPAPIRPELAVLAMDMFLNTKSDLDAKLISLGSDFSVAQQFMLTHLPQWRDDGQGGTQLVLPTITAA
jgi:tRNA(Arg) A34 adenosine deaminase TadA